MPIDIGIIHFSSLRFDVRVASPVCSVRPRVAAAVDQEVLAGDEAGIGAAQEGAVIAELFRAPEAPGRIAGPARPPQLLEGLATVRDHRLDMLALRTTVEDAGQQVVDGDVE